MPDEVVWILLPSIDRGNGTGHLKRLRDAAAYLSGRVVFYLPADRPDPFSEADLGAFLGPRRFDLVRHPREAVGLARGKRAALLCDCRRCEDSLLDAFPDTLPVLGIDEGGGARGRFHYLIDMVLPSGSGPPPNVRLAPLIHGPAPLLGRDGARARGSARGRGNPRGRVLITFGGEDPAGLTEKVLVKLFSLHDPAIESVTVVEGPLFGPRQYPHRSRFSLLRAPDNLASKLGEYDLIITSYGLTAFEARSAGRMVLLFNPSRYHQRMARKHGFVSMGHRRLHRRVLRRSLEQAPQGFPHAAGKSGGGETRKQGRELFPRLVPPAAACPGCGSAARAPALHRQEERSFYRCRACGLIYQLRFLPDKTDYSENYFFRDYAAQYGRSYLEDFQRIKAMGRERLGVVRTLGIKGGALLDIGCAFGPFMAAAAEGGFQPEGVEVSGSAAEYVQRELGFPVFKGQLREYRGGKQYELVTLWYVIEHFPALGPRLEQITKLIKTGGLLAFSTPHARGISGRKNLRAFLAENPADHHSIWDRKSAAALLGRYGFRIERIRYTGHHPERFPLGRVSFLRFLDPLRRLASRLFKLGDTFEVYARKLEREEI